MPQVTPLDPLGWLAGWRGQRTAAMPSWLPARRRAWLLVACWRQQTLYIKHLAVAGVQGASPPGLAGGLAAWWPSPRRGRLRVLRGEARTLRTSSLHYNFKTVANAE